VGPPVGMGAPAMDKDQSSVARRSARQGVDGAAIHLNLDVGLGYRQRTPKPLWGVGSRAVPLHFLDQSTPDRVPDSP
jgi:hypothetical protein